MHRKRRILCCWVFRNHFTSFLWFLCVTLGFVNGYAYTPGGPVLLYATSKDIRIANTSRPGKVLTIVKDLQESSAVDFYLKEQLVCWTDHAIEMIQCVTYNGTYTGEKVRIVTNHLISPNGLATDWYTGKLYWTDGETKRIEVVSVKDRHRKVLFWSDIDQPRAIAVVPMKGLLFWTDWGEVPKIERAGMNGDSLTRRVIVNKDIFWPNGLTIDYETNKIYWLDAKLKFIDVMDFDGSNRKTIVKDGSAYQFALTLFNSRLYWTDWSKWSVYSWDIAAGGPITEVIHSEEVPMDIKVWNAHRQLPPSANTTYPCLNANGNCSHLCLISPDPPGYTCACPTGVKLLLNSSYKCADGPNSILILVQRTTLSRISLDVPDFTPFPLPLHGVKHAISVDYDSVGGYIYWTDDEVRSISKARIDGSDQSIVINGELGSPDGLAVDNLARNLYWTDPYSDTISVARLNGSCRKVVVYDDLYEPRAVSLAPTLGWMFWSDWYERKPKIERASLDGGERVLLISERLGWPNGIALDIAAGKMYWADAKIDKIEMSNMDGSDRVELLSDNLPHIFGLALLGNYIYWTDWQRRSLDRVHKITGREREVIVEQLPNMMGLKTFQLDEQLGTNPCTRNNGDCSHLCFNRPKDYVCGCPIGLELSKDHRTCTAPSAFLLYARKDKIGRISIENQDSEATLPIKDIKDASAMAVHVSEGKIYWADTKIRNIGRCNLNGSNSEKLIEWIGFVEGIAVDWAGHNIYWTDSGLQRIEVARLDGSSRKALIWQGLKKPKSIALDPKRGYMYWSEWGSKTIKRAEMDGSAPSVLLQQVVHANALTIDYEDKNLVWVTLDPPCIEMSDLEGRNRRKLISENIVMPFALTLYDDYIYWADWKTGDIERALKHNGSNRTRIHSRLELVSELAALHPSRQPAAAMMPCFSGNGGCSRLCLAVSGGHSRCACPTHYKLKADNLTCSSPTDFILYAQKNAIGRLLPGGDDCPDAVIPISGLKNVRAVDYDFVKRQIYWFDGRGSIIRRTFDGIAGVSSANASQAASGLSKPVAMAIDPIGRRIYWTGDADTINSTRLENGTNMSVVIRGVQPRHLAIHAEKRFIFWSDMKLGVIMRAAMDGSQQVDITKARNVTAIMVDSRTDSLYWAANRQILACDLEGGNRRTVWQGGSALALGRSRNSLCWADGDRGAVQCASSPAGSVINSQPQPARIALHASHLQYLVAVTPVDTSHVCFNGGSCGAAACLAGGVCGCTGASCAPADCGARHFPCATGPECVPANWRCDGTSDCPDGSDEAGCGHCDPLFRCEDGSCVDRALLCDGIPHCANKEDESNCCNAHSFRCPGTVLCLHSSLVCDHRDDCSDGADESPEACARREAQVDTSVAVPSAPRGASPGAAAAGTVGGIVAAAFAAGAVLYWRRRTRAARQRGGQIPRRIIGGPPRKPPQRSVEAVRLAPLERGQPAGASSPSAVESLLRYPRETLNPPPSPATASSAGGATACDSGRWRPYRHYRSINRPPPPTPCSTDACESDCALAGAPLEAPPPTPCPPSPPSPPSRSSRSSACFSPFPPPPSPVPHHSYH